MTTIPASQTIPRLLCCYVRRIDYYGIAVNRVVDGLAGGRVVLAVLIQRWRDGRRAVRQYARRAGLDLARYLYNGGFSARYIREHGRAGPRGVGASIHGEKRILQLQGQHVGDSRRFRR